MHENSVVNITHKYSSGQYLYAGVCFLKENVEILCITVVN